MMTPAALTRLTGINDFVLEQLRNGRPAGDIIAQLQVLHRASFTCRLSTNTLRAGGITATCTWSKTDGLLDAWRRNAMSRILMAAQA